MGLFVCLMTFNTTFNNISVISWQSILLVEETRGLGENHRPVASHWKIQLPYGHGHDDPEMGWMILVEIYKNL